MYLKSYYATNVSVDYHTHAQLSAYFTAHQIYRLNQGLSVNTADGGRYRKVL